MATIDLDLGVKDIESVALGMRLRLTSSARFAAPADDPLGSFGESLRAILTDMESTPPLWMARGENYRFEVSISFGGVLPSPLEQEVLVERIITDLWKSTVWKQMCLIPTTIEHAFNGCVLEHVVKVFLGAEQTETGASTNNTLRSTVPPQSTQNADVSHGTLQFARATLQLSRLKQDPIDADLLSNTLLDEDVALLDETPDVGSDDELDLLETDHHFVSLEDIPDSPATAVLQADSRTVVEDRNDQSDTRDYAEILEIVDAAIRVCAFGTPMHLAIGVFSVSRHSLVPLAHIAPALWSPGFAKAVTSRSQYINILSESLAAVFRRATAPALRSAVRRSMCEDESSHHVDTPESIVQQKIASRLWTNLQQYYFERKPVMRSIRFLERRPASSDRLELSVDLFAPQEGEDDVQLLHNEFETSQPTEGPEYFDDILDLSQDTEGIDRSEDLFHGGQSGDDDGFSTDDYVLFEDGSNSEQLSDIMCTSRENEVAALLGGTIVSDIDLLDSGVEDDCQTYDVERYLLTRNMAIHGRDY